MTGRLRVLLTGERGFIGTNLSRWLSVLHEVVQPGRRSFHGEYDDGPSVDVRDLDELTEAVALADVVVHLAARKGSWYCDADVVDTVDVNLLGTLRVARVCEQQHKPLLHFGTTAYYWSTDCPVLLDEEADYHPQTVYGLTKLCAELTLDAYDVRYAVVRPVYGYGNIGTRAASRSESWPDVVLREIQRGRTEPLVTDLGGEYIKDYTHISDICSATGLLLVLFMRGELPQGETVLVGAGGNYLFREVMEAFEPPFEVVYRPELDYKKHQPHFYGRLRRYLPCWRARVDALEYARTRGGCC